MRISGMRLDSIKKALKKAYSSDEIVDTNFR
jgi:hypothetical protein